MHDPILEHLGKVREALIKKHGGLDGYFAYVQRLDRAKRRSAKKASGRTKGRLIAKS